MRAPRTTSQTAQPPAAKRSAQQLIDRAIAEGRHSSAFQTMCEGCHRWVSGIYHVTFDGKRVCFDCAVAQGVRFDPAAAKGV